MRKKVDIILVNWNSGEQTLNAAAPYLHHESPNICCNIIVVDNGSTDNSLTILENRVNRLIVNKKNAGFSRACNQAFQGSNADYILLLNPDTKSEPVILEKLVSFLEKNQNYGIAGPSQVDDAGNIMKTCGRFPTFRTAIFTIFGLSKIFPKLFTPAPEMTDWDHSESRDVDHVMGSYMVIRKSILDKIGFMDNEYFMYFEDIDLSKRFSDVGFKTFYDRTASIHHQGGGTGKRLQEYRLFYSLTSRRIYWRKYFGKFNCFILVALSLGVEPALRILNSLFDERVEFQKTLKAFSMYVKKIVTGQC